MKTKSNSLGKQPICKMTEAEVREELDFRRWQAAKIIRLLKDREPKGYVSREAA